ncbi:MAG TPA: glycosyltransferase family 2 protein [Nitrospiraceae bacterium]|nr:glycosyltransferase family 2 protein [Nitrospiraceae bacterium]
MTALSAWSEKVSVVVPVFNSAGSLPLLAERVDKALKALGWDYELILVDDGSSDGSGGVIQMLAAKSAKVRGMLLMRNYGQHNALLCAIRAARFEIIVTLDDDLQHPPEEIPKLLQKLGEGYDVVYGTPEKEPHGFWRGLASRVTKLALQSAMGVKTARGVSAFRTFRRDVREAFVNYQGPFVSIDVLLTWGTARFAAIPVRHAPRTIGQSNYTFRKLLRHALNMMTGFSTMPLKLASLLGFVLTFFGAVILLFVVGRYLVQGTSVPGFPFLASIIAIFSGAQLFTLGVIGEYLARMHFRMMDRPTYVVRSTTFPITR